MRIRELLPIGTIVLLEDAEKRLMISGVMQTDETGDGTEYDYLGILYPEGNVGEDFQFLFNHKDIKEVFFRGYEDEEREQFIENLSKFYGQN